MSTDHENQDISEDQKEQDLLKNPFFDFFTKLEKMPTASFKGISENLELIFCIDSEQFEEILNNFPLFELGLLRINSSSFISETKFKNGIYYLNEKNSFYLFINEYETYTRRYQIFFGKNELQSNEERKLLRAMNLYFSRNLQITSYINYIRKEVLSEGIQSFFDEGLELYFNRNYIGVDRRNERDILKFGLLNISGKVFNFGDNRLTFIAVQRLSTFLSTFLSFTLAIFFINQYFAFYSYNNQLFDDINFTSFKYLGFGNYFFLHLFMIFSLFSLLYRKKGSLIVWSFNLLFLSFICFETVYFIFLWFHH